MDKAKWSVAVVIPAFNRERLIATAIESALAQTLPPNEIIVVDDGSTDATASVVSQYPAPVRLIEIENTGVGPSRPKNVGIREAKSKYITLLDSDDYLAPSLLERHRDLFALAPDVGLISNNFRIARQLQCGQFEWISHKTEILDEVEKKEILPNAFLLKSEAAYRACCQGFFTRTSGTIFSRRVWETIGGFDETLRIWEDYRFALRVAAKYDIAYIEEPLTTFVHHDANYVTARNSYPVEEQVCLCHLRVLWEELSQSQDLENRRRLRCRIHECLFGLAWRHRVEGEYLSSLRTYSQYVLAGGSLTKALSGSMKVLVHGFWRPINAGRYQS